MLIHEDPSLEEAAISGAFCVIVPASVFVPETGECVITAYKSIWETCQDFETRFAGDPLSDDARKFLLAAVKDAAESIGYTPSPRDSQITCEYSLYAPNDSLRRYAAEAILVTDPAQIEGIGSRLLHTPDPSCIKNDEPVAVVVSDGEIIAVSATNDFSDSDAIEVYVETAKDYRGRGLGRAAVAALSLELLRRGDRVAYKCAEKNVASNKIAERLGFTREGRRLSIVCLNK